MDVSRRSPAYEPTSPVARLIRYRGVSRPFVTCPFGTAPPFPEDGGSGVAELGSSDADLGFPDLEKPVLPCGEQGARRAMG